MAAIRLQHEDLVVDVVSLVPVQVGHRRAVRQDVERLAVPQRLSAPLRHHVGHELLAARLVVPCPHHGVAHPGLVAEHRFDFAELHAVAVQLDLVVDPATELDGAVG